MGAIKSKRELKLSSRAGGRGVFHGHCRVSIGYWPRLKHLPAALHKATLQQSTGHTAHGTVPRSWSPFKAFTSTPAY